jgi:uncharacterized protein
LFGITRSKETRWPGRFELLTDKSGEIRWYLRASNGDIIASSQAYKSKAAAEKGSIRSSRTRLAATAVDNTG